MHSSLLLRLLFNKRPTLQGGGLTGFTAIDPSSPDREDLRRTDELTNLET